MSEVTKLYENAGIKPCFYCSNPRLDCDVREKEKCKQDCEYYSGERLLTPFTAEKQLSLIKWLCDTDYFITEFCRLIDTREYYIETNYKHFQSSSFEETLAGLINKLWQSLTEEEKQQVKEILE